MGVFLSVLTRYIFERTENGERKSDPGLKIKREEGRHPSSIVEQFSPFSLSSAHGQAKGAREVRHPHSESGFDIVAAHWEPLFVEMKEKKEEEEGETRKRKREEGEGKEKGNSTKILGRSNLRRTLSGPPSLSLYPLLNCLRLSCQGRREGGKEEKREEEKRVGKEGEFERRAKRGGEKSFFMMCASFSSWGLLPGMALALSPTLEEDREEKRREALSHIVWFNAPFLSEAKQKKWIASLSLWSSQLSPLFLLNEREVREIKVRNFKKCFLFALSGKEGQHAYPPADIFARQRSNGKKADFKEREEEMEQGEKGNGHKLRDVKEETCVEEDILEFMDQGEIGPVSNQMEIQLEIEGKCILKFQEFLKSSEWERGVGVEEESDHEKEMRSDLQKQSDLFPGRIRVLFLLGMCLISPFPHVWCFPVLQACFGVLEKSLQGERKEKKGKEEIDEGESGEEGECAFVFFSLILDFFDLLFDCVESPTPLLFHDSFFQCSPSPPSFSSSPLSPLPPAPYLLTKAYLFCFHVFKKWVHRDQLHTRALSFFSRMSDFYCSRRHRNREEKVAPSSFSSLRKKVLKIPQNTPKRPKLEGLQMGGRSSTREIPNS